MVASTRGNGQLLDNVAKVLGRKRKLVHIKYRLLIPKDYDWSKHQDDKSYIELIAELKFHNRLRKKLNHFGMSMTYIFPASST